MWQTGYPHKVVEDKIRESINFELPLEWTRFLGRPGGITDQLAMLQDMGLALEDHKMSRKLQWPEGEKGDGKS